MARVQYLDLRRNFRMEDTAVAAALASGHVGHLRYLSLDSCYAVGEATFAAIVAHLPELRGLQLGMTRLDDTTLLALAALPHLAAMHGLFMNPTLTRAGVAAFRSARPEVHVTFTWD